MKKYTFIIESAISMHIDVEANNLEEATELAQNASVMSLCWQCAHGKEGEWSTSGELDCDPSTSELVDCYEDEDRIDLNKVKW